MASGDGGHEFYKRDDGLCHCKVCGGAEGSLPTDCPRSPMTEQQQGDVYAGQIDFLNGNWITRRAK